MTPPVETDSTSPPAAPPHPPRSLIACLIAVLAVALVARTGWTAYRWWSHPGGAGLQFPDEVDYWTGAVSLAKGEGLMDADGRRATRMPLYPALISLVADSPSGAWWARLVQSLVAALVAPLMAVLAWRLAGLRAAWLAGLMGALDPFGVYFSHLLLTETLLMTGLAALCVVAWPLALPDGRRRSWRWPATGAIFLAMVYLHPAAVGLLPVWAVFVVIAARRVGGNFAGVTLISLMLLAGLAPWVWRNHRLLGEPVLLTTRLGISLYDGQGPQADGSSNLAFTRDMPAHKFGECDWNRWFRDEALRAMRADPWRACRLALTKARRMWDPMPHAAEARTPAIQVVSAVWSLGVFALVAPGLWAWRRRIACCLLLMLPGLYLTGVYMVLVGSIRYRLPAMPMVEILSAVGLCWLVGLIRPGWRPGLPPTAPAPQDHQPTSWLERHVYAPRFGRHPVPVWRRRIALAGLLALALGYYAYQYFTSDERIRQQAVNFLSQFTGGEVRIGKAKFALFSGISLHDVTIAMPGDVDFDPTASRFEERQVFAAVTLDLQYEPFSLLTGRLKVEEILAVQPTLTLVKNANHPSYTYNWQTLFPPRPKKARAGRAHLPLIRIRHARVRIVEILEGRHHAEPEIDLSAMAIPDADRLDTYTLAWRKTGEQPEEGRLFYKLTDGTYIGELPTLPVTTVKATLPQRYREWLETLEIAGQIKPEQIHYDARHGSRATIGLEGVRLTVPLATEERPTTQVAKRFLRLSKVKGQLVLTPTQSSARIKGVLNEADCDVTATVTNYAGPLEEAGFDIQVKTANIRLPDPNDPAGARFIQRIHKVRCLFRDFDPHGRVDLDFHLIKSPGRDMGVTVRGVLRPRGCDASYKSFPYRLTDIAGTVRFADDGIHLENLVGNHGSGLAVINGHLDDPTWITGLRLHVVGDNVPLDPALYHAVPEKFRAIWRRFDTVGLANLEIRLRRAPGTQETGPGRWDTHIQAELLETFARFVDFPYRLRHVAGGLTIDNDRIELAGLTGGHGSASVRLDGTAHYGSEDDRELELRLEAGDLPIDDNLAAALPAEGRKAFRQMRPTGTVGLLGRVFMPPGHRHVSCDITARPRDAAVCYESLPYRVDRICGTLRFTPKRIDLVSLTGRHGRTKITAKGHVERRADGNLADVTLGCDRLNLTQELYKALPARHRQTWDRIRPTGEIRLKTRIRRAGSGPKRVSTHETTIDALGNTVCYEGLPLPINDVRGQICIRDESAELVKLTGRHGQGRVSLNGRIPLVGEKRTGRLRLRADGMPFDEPLRKALPWRIRGTWNDLEPTGTFDLDLEELTYHTEPNRPAAWTYRGRLTVHDATLNVGFKATQLEGSLTGHGTVRGDGSGMTIDGDLKLTRGAVNQRVLTDVTGRMRRRPGSNVLLLDDLEGYIYGGQAAGFARVTFDRRHTRYALYMIVREMALGPFLNSTRPKDAPPTEAKGAVDGRLYLSGISGQVQSRQGTGEVHIRNAQMYKLPFILAMLSTVNFTIPDDNAFHDAHARFHLHGDRLEFDTIECRGRSLSMSGTGSMDTETETLDLTFITGSPHRLPRLPLLTEMVQGVSRELMEIEIAGPLSRPKMQGRPLRTLRTTVEALLRPQRARVPDE